MASSRPTGRRNAAVYRLRDMMPPTLSPFLVSGSPSLPHGGITMRLSLGSVQKFQFSTFEKL